MTRIFKVRVFERLTRKTDVDDEALAKAIKEADDGLIDADLGGGLIKIEGGTSRRRETRRLSDDCRLQIRN